MVSEEESQRRHLDTGGGFTRKHDRRARTANSLASWTDRDVCQRPCAITFGRHRRCPLWKKSLVDNLSAKRQLSVAKLSAKRIFSLAKRDFLVANGRMAADFSSPALTLPGQNLDVDFSENRTGSGLQNLPNDLGILERMQDGVHSSTTVSRQQCERQECEGHQCEARSTNANSAKETTVRMRQECEGQVCEGQECECDFSAIGQNSEMIRIVRSRSFCFHFRMEFGLKKKY